MNRRERLVAAINGKETDKLPFWPKLNFGGAYEAAQKNPFNAMTREDIYDWVGCEYFIGDLWPYKQSFGNTKSESIDLDGAKKNIITTNLGSVESISGFDPSTNSWYVKEHKIKTVEDIKIMTEYYNNTKVDCNPDFVEKSKAFHTQTEKEGKAAVIANMGQSPFMNFVEILAGVAEAHFLTMDYETAVLELLDAMHKVNLQKVKVLAENSLADMICTYENTSTTTISPDQHRQFCVPYLSEYAKIFKEHNKNFVIHMCGHIDDFIDDFVKIPASIYEAITTPPVGNTHLHRIREKTEKVLIGGSNATMWLGKPSAIIAEIEEELDLLPHHRNLVFSTGGELPIGCTPETIKEVCDWVHNYKMKI